MNEPSQNKQSVDPFDALLQEALHTRSSEQPRAGFTSRLLARVEADKPANVTRLWVWIIGPAMAVLLVVIANSAVRFQGSAKYGAPANRSMSLGTTPKLPTAQVEGEPEPHAKRPFKSPERLAELETVGPPQGRRTGQLNESNLTNKPVMPKLDTFPSHDLTENVAFGTGPALPLPTPSLQAAEQVNLLRAEQASSFTIARLQITPLTMHSGEQP